MMHINNLRYNERLRAFEASVDIVRDGRTYRYPCEVFGPASLSPSFVVASLHNRARRMSDTTRH